MIHLLMADGSHKEVTGAQSAAVEGDSLVLRDAAGAVVEAVSALTVSAFGALGEFFAGVVEDAATLDTSR